MANLESQGVKVFWSATTGVSTAIQVGQVVSISGPTGSAAKIDVSNLDSAGKEFLMGLPDEGDISLDVIYDPSDTGQSLMWTDRAARTKKSVAVQLTDTATSLVKAKAFCTGFSITGAVDDAIKATVTLAITGAAYVSSGTTYEN